MSTVIGEELVGGLTEHHLDRLAGLPAIAPHPVSEQPVVTRTRAGFDQVSSSSSLAFASVSPGAVSALALFSGMFAHRADKPRVCGASCGTPKEPRGLLTRWLRSLALSGATCCA
jgi:hypothetical protein